MTRIVFLLICAGLLTGCASVAERTERRSGTGFDMLGLPEGADQDG